MTSDTQPRTIDLSLPQIIGGSVAAATAAALSTRVGLAGTIAGAAFASVISAVVAASLSAWLHRAGRLAVDRPPTRLRSLAIGVGAGVLAAMALFARRVAHFATVERTVVEVNGENVATYTVDGELFFASSNDLYTQFDYANDPDRVVIDLSSSHIWDASTVAALDAITTKYERRGTTVAITGLNEASAERHDRLSGRLPSH